MKEAIGRLERVELSEVGEWQIGSQLFLLFLLLLCFMGTGYWLALESRLAQLESLKQNEGVLRSSLVMKANRVSVLPSLQSDLTALRNQYDYLLQQLPVQKELAQLLSSVGELGKRNNLSFSRIEWGEKEQSSGFFRLPLNIELQGSYADIGRFCEAIANLPRAVSFADISLQRIDAGSGRLRFIVTAHTYQFRPESEENGATQ